MTTDGEYHYTYDAEGNRTSRFEWNEIVAGRRQISKASAVKLSDYFGVNPALFIRQPFMRRQWFALALWSKNETEKTVVLSFWVID